ncbi:type II toxin-antitoxin system HigA family antitoxin [Massilia sp. BJB1822]|uniref:helix-turn-helix domain-containing protein n=1 Tax=Massilia sp. BJB1822 TaxID=2744470 RepID=UPI001C3C34B5|nr:transcriptional regulator [Massilia sp. BJB1822]
METLTDKSAITEVTRHFLALQEYVPLRPIHTEDSYEAAISSLNALLDQGAANEEHPLAALVNALGTLIQQYEAIHFPPEPVSPTDMLRMLMEQHRLSQSDLPEVGAQSVVSEVLSGKRELNLRQIRALADRFKLPPEAFL